MCFGRIVFAVDNGDMNVYLLVSAVPVLFVHFKKVNGGNYKIEKRITLFSLKHFKCTTFWSYLTFKFEWMGPLNNWVRCMTSFLLFVLFCYVSAVRYNHQAFLMDIDIDCLRCNRVFIAIFAACYRNLNKHGHVLKYHNPIVQIFNVIIIIDFQSLSMYSDFCKHHFFRQCKL